MDLFPSYKPILRQVSLTLIDDLPHLTTVVDALTSNLPVVPLPTTTPGEVTKTTLPPATSTTNDPATTTVTMPTRNTHTPTPTPTTVSTSTASLTFFPTTATPTPTRTIAPTSATSPFTTASSSSNIIPATSTSVPTLSPVTTSSAVPIVSVSTSGSIVTTYTSTSYSHYVTSLPTQTPNNRQPSAASSDIGAIVGGVVGGIAFAAITVIAAVLLTRRRQQRKTKDRNKFESEGVGLSDLRPSGGGGGGGGGVFDDGLNTVPFHHYYQDIAPENDKTDANYSFNNNRPLSAVIPTAVANTTTASQQQQSPSRPFVQPYNPGTAISLTTPGYDGQMQQQHYHQQMQQQQQQQQHYFSNYDTTDYDYNNNTAYYHPQPPNHGIRYYPYPVQQDFSEYNAIPQPNQQEQFMVPISNSIPTGLSNERNVPDENDYDNPTPSSSLKRTESRHVPDEATTSISTTTKSRS